MQFFCSDNFFLQNQKEVCGGGFYFCFVLVRSLKKKRCSRKSLEICLPKPAQHNNDNKKSKTELHECCMLATKPGSLTECGSGFRAEHEVDEELQQQLSAVMSDDVLPTLKSGVSALSAST